MPLKPQVTTDLKRDLPPWVTEVRSAETTGVDGEPALIVFLVVKQELRVLEDAEELLKARQTVATIFAKHHIEQWPFVRFISEEEPSHSERE